MPKLSSAFTRCCFPVNFDPYAGCSHGCSYCYANRGTKKKREEDYGAKIKNGESVKSLEAFIGGARGQWLKWCDWNIPVCIGRNSDPFQPCEKERRRTLECLRLLAKTGYPFIVTTKGTMLAEDEEYFSVIKDCNCVVQISMLCGSMDAMERGAPSYERRLAAVGKLSPVVRRVIARWQPLFLEKTREAVREIPRLRDAGAYGVLCETPFLNRPIGKCNVLVRPGFNPQYKYPYPMCERTFVTIRSHCHKNGLAFLCSESKRLSDSLLCCCGNGLDDFVPSRCNAQFYYLGKGAFCPTQGMKKIGTGIAFHCVFEGRRPDRELRRKSFAELMIDAVSADSVRFLTTRG